MSSRSASIDERALRNVFKDLCDVDGNITSDKLRNVLHEMDLEFTEDDIQDMIEVADSSGTGQISYENIVGMITEADHMFPTFTAVPTEDRALSNTSRTHDTSPDSNFDEKDLQDASANNSIDVKDVQDTSQDNIIDEKDIQDTSPNNIIDEKDVGEKDLRRVFQKMCGEHGNITLDQLRNVVQDLDLDFSDDEIQDMIKVADETGGGNVSYRSMVGMIKESKTTFPKYAEIASKEALRRELTALALVRDDSEMATNTESAVKTNNENKSEHTEANDTDEEDNFAATRIPVAVSSDALTITDDMNKEKSDPSNDSDLDKEVDHDEQSVTDSQEESGKATKNHHNERVTSSRLSSVEEHSLDSSVITAVGRYKKTKRKKTIIEESNNAENPEKDTPDDNTLKQREIAEENDNGQNETNPLRSPVSKDGPSEEIRKSNALKAVNTKLMVKTSSTKKTNSTHSNTTPRGSISDANVPKRNAGAVKHIGKTSKGSTGSPKTDAGYYSGIGCALKLSQLRMKQRLLYIMWKTLYDEAVEKMQTEDYEKQTRRKKKR